MSTSPTPLPGGGLSATIAGDFGPAANTLVTRASDAIGGLFRPWQIKRVAKAEVEAERIRVEAQIEVSDLQRRALLRFINEETQRQANMESILHKALPEVAEGEAKPEQIENDWLTTFFDHCRLVSDDEMQALWAKVLAGEANQPGTFAKRTLDFLKTMAKEEAHFFELLLSVSLVDYKGWHFIIVGEATSQTLAKATAGRDVAGHMQDIGILAAEHKSAEVSQFKGQNFWYGDETYRFVCPPPPQLPASGIKPLEYLVFLCRFSMIGQQLSRVAKQKAIPDFIGRLSNSLLQSVELRIERSVKQPLPPT